MKRMAMVVLAAMVTMCLLSTSAMALTTAVNPIGDDDFAARLQGVGGVLDRLYGLENLTRIDDDLDHEFFLGAGFYRVAGEAKYAAWTQNIGVITSGGMQSLFTMTGSDFEQLNKYSAYFTLTNDDTVKFYDTASNADGTWTTDPNDNDPGDFDHAVSYLITSGDYEGDIILAFEDKNLGDWDYNDAVVRITASTPEPGTIMLLGFGLLGLGVVARRRK